MNHDFLIDIEKKLLQPSLRKNKIALEEILHTDFFEFGALGQKWDRSATIESLTKEESVDYIVSDFSTHPISQDVALLTYAAELKGKKRSEVLSGRNPAILGDFSSIKEPRRNKHFNNKQSFIFTGSEPVHEGRPSFALCENSGSTINSVVQL